MRARGVDVAGCFNGRCHGSKRQAQAAPQGYCRAMYDRLFSDYSVSNSKLGSGTYGYVVLGLDKKSREARALKFLREHEEREETILRALSHNNGRGNLSAKSCRWRRSRRRFGRRFRKSPGKVGRLVAGQLAGRPAFGEPSTRYRLNTLHFFLTPQCAAPYALSLGPVAPRCS